LELLDHLLLADSDCDVMMSPHERMGAHFHHSRLCLKVGRVTDSLSSALWVLQYIPHSLQALQLVFKCYLKLEQMDDARDIAQQIYELNTQIQDKDQRALMEEPTLQMGASWLTDMPSQPTISSSKRYEQVTVSQTSETTLQIDHRRYRVASRVTIVDHGDDDDKDTSYDIHRLVAPLPMYIIPDLFTSSEADAVSTLFDDHIIATDTMNRYPPLLCFGDSSPLLERLIAANLLAMDTNSQTNGATSDISLNTEGGGVCINSSVVSLERQRELISMVPFSRSTLIFRDEDPLIDRLHQRLVRITGLSSRHAEPAQLLRYEQQTIVKPFSSTQIRDDSDSPDAVNKSQQPSYDRIDIGYAPHVDCAPDLGADTRAWTVLVYLSDLSVNETGGETRFPKLSISVRPKKGMAFIFKSLNDDGFCMASYVVTRIHHEILSR
jgi:hypothetical protein